MGTDHGSPDPLGAGMLVSVSAKAPHGDILDLRSRKTITSRTVLPVIAAAAISATIEKKLHKVPPTWLDKPGQNHIDATITSFCHSSAAGPVRARSGVQTGQQMDRTRRYNTLDHRFGGGLPDLHMHRSVQYGILLLS